MTVPAPRNGVAKLCPESKQAPFDQPINYDLMALNAGGPGWVEQNGFGVCGDRIGSPQSHADDGKYARDFIAATYRPGEEIDITVTITAHHKGYFQFRLCEAGQSNQDCLDKNLLKLVGRDDSKWWLPPRSAGGDEIYKMAYKLPRGVTCEHCVL